MSKLERGYLQFNVACISSESVRRGSRLPSSVLAFNHEDAKAEAARKSGVISALGRNLSTRRLSAETLRQPLENGARDLRK